MLTAISAALVAGTFVGFLDGLCTLYRNVYVPQFAAMCLLGPIVSTSLFACVLAFPLVWILRLWTNDESRLAVRTAAVLCGVYAVLAILNCWGRASASAHEAGAGTWLIGLAFALLLTLVVGAMLVLWRLVERAAPAAARSWARRGGSIALSANLLCLVPLVSGFMAEGQHVLYGEHTGAARAANELNVLLVSIDTLRADRLAGMPNLSRFAAAAARFDTAISQSSWTLPAIASLMTGQPPAVHGTGFAENAFDLLARSPLADGTWTLARALKHCGYYTHAVVTNPYLSRRYGLGAGFDRYENITMESEALLVLRDTLIGRIVLGAWPKLMIGDIGETVNARAVPWLERHAHEKFFLWLHYLDPHAPYGDPAVLGNKSFRGDTLFSAVMQHGDRLGPRFGAIARLRAGEIHLDDEQRRELIALYDAGVRYVDAQIGALFEQLDRLRLREHTLIVVTSDHGEEFWEHGGVEHGHSVYDELIHVPLVVYWPPDIPKRRIDAVVRLIDVAPTIVDLSGCADAPHVEGRSLRGLLRGEGDAPRVALSEGLLFADNKIGVRNATTKYVRWSNGKEELYDLQSDPREQRDMAGIEELVAPQRQLFANRRAPNAGSAPPASAADGATQERLRALGYGQ